MKKAIGILSIFMLLGFLVSCEKEQVLTVQDLPTPVTTYVSTHFSSATIIKIEKERRDSEYYEITLSNGVKLEFDMNNNIIEISSNSKLPDSVIPAAILTYVNTNYASNFIIGWELKLGNQEVKLNNNLELIFSMSGDFIRVDD